MPSEAKAKGSILIVEDDSASAFALRSILTRLGWQVTDVQTVRDALIHLAGAFDVLILDLMLPDGDGLDVLRHVRRINPKCRVAVTTGVSDPERLKNVADHSPGVILRKPIDLQALIRFLDSPLTH